MLSIQRYIYTAQRPVSSATLTFIYVLLRFQTPPAFDNTHLYVRHITNVYYNQPQPRTWCAIINDGILVEVGQVPAHRLRQLTFSIADSFTSSIISSSLGEYLIFFFLFMEYSAD